MPTEEVFIEPLAAACEILEQVRIRNAPMAVLGDGKLGLLVAQALKAMRMRASQRQTQEKLRIAGRRGVDTAVVGRGFHSPPMIDR